MSENGRKKPERQRDGLGGWLKRSASHRDRRDLAAYQRLALQLHHDLADQDRQSVLVLSPTDPHVSARSAALLAISAADQLGEDVLLVDACPEHPELSALLGETASDGFSDLSHHGAGDAPAWDTLVRKTTAPHVHFLAAGGSGHAPKPSDTQNFLKDVNSHYAMLIITGGAVLSDLAALALAPDTGCSLIAVVEHQTKIADLEQAQQTIALARAPQIGLMLVERTRRGLSPAPDGGIPLRTVPAGAED